MIIAYGDGSCDNNNKEAGGGIGCVINYKGKILELSEGPFDNATSARMEIMAVIRILEVLDGGHDILIHSDNQYVVKTHQEGWLKGWIKKGMLNEKANPDLWKRFLKALHRHESQGSTVTLKWIKGHAGHVENERCDELANIGRKNTKKTTDENN